MIKRIINISVLPGQDPDLVAKGAGQVCIHLFVIDEKGPFVEPNVLHPARDEEGKIIKKKLIAKPTRGRLACDPKKTVAPVVKKNVTYITHRTDDPNAVSCLKCKASKDYDLMMSLYNNRKKSNTTEVK